MLDVHLICRFCGRVDKEDHSDTCTIGAAESCKCAWEGHCKNCCSLAAKTVKDAMHGLENRTRPVREAAIPQDFIDKQIIKLNPKGKRWEDYQWCEDLAFKLSGCTHHYYRATTNDGIRVSWSDNFVMANRVDGPEFSALGGSPYGAVNLALFQLRAVKDFALTYAERKWLNACAVPKGKKEKVTGVRFVTYNECPEKSRDESVICTGDAHRGSLVIHTMIGEPNRNGNVCNSYGHAIGEDWPGSLPKGTTCNDGWRLAFALAEKHGWRLVP